MKVPWSLIELATGAVMYRVDVKEDTIARSRVSGGHSSDWSRLTNHIVYQLGQKRRREITRVRAEFELSM